MQNDMRMKLKRPIQCIHNLNLLNYSILPGMEQGYKRNGKENIR